MILPILHLVALQYHSKIMNLRNAPFGDIPMDLEPELRRMINPDPTARPSASEFACQ